jgi:hypothetical protein
MKQDCHAITEAVQDDDQRAAKNLEREDRLKETARELQALKSELQTEKAKLRI